MRKYKILFFVWILVITCFYVPDAFTDYTNRWDFLSAPNYYIPDPTLVEVDETPPGYAQLLLQAEEHYYADITNYLASTSYSLVTFGSPVSFLLTGSGGLYNSPGIFTSRILDGGSGNVWEMIIARASNRLFLNSTAELLPTSLGMVGLWHMNNNWQDATINANNGSPSGAGFSADAPFGSHSGDFSGNWKVVAGAVPVTNQITISFWVKANQVDSLLLSYPIGFGQGSANRLQIRLGGSYSVGFSPAGSIGLLSTSAAGSTGSGTFSDQDIGIWRHIVITYDKNATDPTHIYKDGIELTLVIQTLSGTIPSHNSLYFGVRADNGFPLNGFLDEVAIYNRVLTAKEVIDLYNAGAGLRVRVRSNSTSNPSGPFVGPDDTTNSFYFGVREVLQNGTNFNTSHRYAQYQAQLFSSAYNSETPYIESVALFGTRGVQFDSTLVDYHAGDYTLNTTNLPAHQETPYIGLAKKRNGGYYTSGVYESRVFDALNTVTWQSLSWTIAEELNNSASGLMGLYHLNGNWSDVAPGGGDNSPGSIVNPSYSSKAKVGSQAVLFNDGASSSHAFGFGLTNSRSIMFWVYDDNPNDGIMDLSSNSYIGITNHTITTVGTGGNMPAIYLNGCSGSRKLLPGWNLVALVWSQDIDLSSLDVGVAGGDYMGGLFDELAIYSRELTSSEIKAHYVSARPNVSGVATLQVRGADTLVVLGTKPWSGNFTDPDTATFLVDGRYFQYRATLAGDGNYTPGFGSVIVSGDNAGTPISFIDDSWDKAAGGDFVSGQTAWYGDETKLIELSGTAPINLYAPLEVSLAGLWHLDDPNDTGWGFGDPVYDTSGNGRHGNAAGGVLPSSKAYVGLRCAQFDGVDDYISLGFVTEIANNDFTVSGWINSSASNRSAIISTYALGSSYFSLEMNGDGTALNVGKVAFVIDDGISGSKSAVSYMSDLNDGEWHYIVGVRLGQYIYLYVDGNRVAGEYLGGSYGLLSAGSPVLARRGPAGAVLNCYIDEVAIWGRALTKAEIGNNFAGGYRTKGTGEYISETVDAGRRSIWQTFAWVTDGSYGNPLSSSDTTLEALWRMEDISGPITNMVTINDGTVVGAPVFGVTGKLDKCVSLNGGDYFTIANNINIEPATITVEAWVNMNEANNITIFDKSNGGGNGYILATDNNGRPYFEVDGIICTAFLPVRVGEWTHIAGLYDGTELKIYINGEVGAVKSAIGLTPASGAQAIIGRSAGGSGDFKGLIDEVAIHNRALDPNEMLDHYKGGALTLKFQVRVSDTNNFVGIPFIGPGTNTSTYYTESSGSPIVDDLDLGQYFQYKAFFESDTYRFSPILSGVKLFVSSYPGNNPTIEPTEGQGYTFPGELISFNDSRTYNPNTDVQYQISGDSGGSPRWFYWDGSKWDEEIGLGYPLNTSSSSDISTNINLFYDELYSKIGGLFRVRSFFHSEGDQQISVDWLDLIASEGRIVVVTPNGTENGDASWISQVSYDIDWTWVGNVSSNLIVEYSLDGLNGTWITITNSVYKGLGGIGSLKWKTAKTVNSTNCFIRVRDPVDITIRDDSDSAFTITKRFRLTSPNGGEKWYMGTTTNIVWESAWGNESLAQLLFAPDGTNYIDPQIPGNPIIFATPNVNENKTNVYSWAIPADNTNLLSEVARIMVKKPTGTPTYEDESDGTFTLAGIVITAPMAGAKVKRNAPFILRWSSAGAGSAISIDFSNDSGATFTNTIFASVTNTLGTNGIVWNVLEGGTDTAVLRFRSLSDTNVVGYSPVFTLADIDVTTPDGGEIWLMNTTNTITWTSGGAGSLVNIYFSINGGSSWINIESGISNSHSYAWTVSDLVSKTARIMVESVADTNLWSMSASDFNIAGVRVVFPNTSTDTLEVGKSYWLLHDGSPDAWSGSKLEISYDDGSSFQFVDPSWPAWNLGDPIQFTPDYPSTKTKIRATVINSPGYTNVFDESDELFTVAGIVIEAPTNGAEYTIGSTTPINWISAGTLPSGEIFYSDDDTNNFVSLAIVTMNLGYPGNNTWNWTLGSQLIPSINARIKVESGTYKNISDLFTVRGIRITSPSDGTIWDVGSTQYVQWAKAGVDSSARGTIALSLNGGLTFPYTLTTNYAVVDVDFYQWAIDPSYDPTTNALLRMQIDTSIVPNDTNIVAYSDPFTLKGVKIISPIGGGAWELGTTNDIVFITAAAGSSATISYSANGGNSFEVNPIANPSIVDGINTNSWVIELDREPSTNALIFIQGTLDSGSSPTFTVGGVNVQRPMQYDIWAVGESNIIQWISVGTEGTNTLELVYEDLTTYLITNNYVGSQLDWLVLSNALPGGASTVSNVVLRLRDTGGYEGVSEPFKLVSQPRIEIVAPSAGEYWKAGDTRTIEWIKGGHMNAGEFKAYYYYGSNLTQRVEVLNSVNFNSSNNTFSMQWSVPNLLGTTKILVTNTVRNTIFDMSGNFDIVGNFRVSYPNGDFLEDPLYALTPVVVTWGTKGSVDFIDIYYKVASNNWVKVNSSPVPNNGGWPSEVLSSTIWQVPDVQSVSVKFRVQDANYTNIFDGLSQGPYDDSDNNFAIRYYAVHWNVYYIDEYGLTNRLDQLSVSDSSGWSESGLSSLSSNITHYYPYGTYDTEWFREYFNDTPDFHWLCDSNDMVREILMTKSYADPNYQVMANFTYDLVKTNFMIQTWLERGGAILGTPDDSTIKIYDSLGNAVTTIVSSVTQNGVFWQNWNVSGSGYDSTEVFWARVEIKFAGEIYSSGITFMMRQTASSEIMSVIDIINASSSNILSSVSGVSTNISALSSNVTAFRSEVQFGISNITNMIDGTRTDITNMLESTRTDIVASIDTNMMLLTNSIIPNLDLLTNQIIEIIGPSVTNINNMVSNINDTVDSDLARILTRPTTVSYGSTNTILYKTRSGYNSAVVSITVSNSSEGLRYSGNMAEIVGGIYQQDLVANWGTNNYIIMCADPQAFDSMVVEVAADDANTIPSSIAEISNHLDVIESQITNVVELVKGVNGADLTGIMDGINNIETAVNGIVIPQGDKIDLTALGRIEEILGSSTTSNILVDLEARLGDITDTSSDNTLFGKLNSMSGQLDDVGSYSSSASKYAYDASFDARSAKTEAKSASSGIQALKDDIAKGNPQEALNRLADIKSSLINFQQNMAAIPKLLPLAMLHNDMKVMAKRIEDLAKSKGFEYLINMSDEKEKAESGDEVDDQSILLLNQNMQEMRASMEFMRKMLDEKIYEPVIQETLLAEE